MFSSSYTEEIVTLGLANTRIRCRMTYIKRREHIFITRTDFYRIYIAEYVKIKFSQYQWKFGIFF